MTPIVLFSGRARSGKDTAARVLCDEYRGVAVAFADPIKRFLQASFGLHTEQLWGADKEAPIEVRCRAGSLVETLRRVVGMSLLNELSALNDYMSIWRSTHAVDGTKTTPRRLMQTFGTEVVRAVKPDLWLEVGLRDAQRILQGGCTYLRSEGVVPVGEGKVNYNLVCIPDGRFRNELLGVKRLGGFCVQINRPIENGLSVDAKAHASEVEQMSIPPWWYDANVENDKTLESFQFDVRRLLLRRGFG